MTLSTLSSEFVGVRYPRIIGTRLFVKDCIADSANERRLVGELLLPFLKRRFEIIVVLRHEPLDDLQCMLLLRWAKSPVAAPLRLLLFFHYAPLSILSRSPFGRPFFHRTPAP